MSVLTAALRPLTLALIAFQQPREIPNLPPPAPMPAVRADDSPIRATVQARRERAYKRARRVARDNAETARWAAQEEVRQARALEVQMRVARVQAEVMQAQAAQQQALASQQRANAAMLDAQRRAYEAQNPQHAAQPLWQCDHCGSVAQSLLSPGWCWKCGRGHYNTRIR
jgi:hypothetical protein